MERNSIYLQLFTLLFLSLSLFLITCSSTAAITKATDQSSLLSLKSRITSDPHDNIFSNWTITTPVCDWVGVTCGKRHRRVTSLDISYMSLTGEIPPELGNLSFLISLDMTGNHFSGMIPEDLSRLRRLRFLRIGDNSFAGEVPSCFASLSRLEVLYLNNNSFTSLDSLLVSFSNESKLDTLDVSFNSIGGNIPESMGNLGRGLKQLNMGDNQLSGFLPSSLGNLTSLVSLQMRSNYIEGSLPEGIGNLRNLIYLNFRSNQLVGSISSSLFNISTIEYFGLSRNNISGTLPDDVCLRLPSVKELYMASNELFGEIPSNISLCSQLRAITLTFNSITGEIPHAFGEIARLELLDLGGNGLSGFVPTNILHNLTRLRKFQLAGNSLSGNLPSKSGYFLPNLETFLVGDNDFVGVFPSFILNSSKLVILDLSHNKLTGPIPTSLGDLRFLQFLNLEENGFKSDSALTTELSFINSLTNCRNLRVLSLSSNPLSGVVPSSIGNFSSSLTDIRAYLCGIRGNIPSEIGNLTGLISLILDDNYLTGELPRTIPNLASLQLLALGDNRIKGLFPNELCRLSSLGILYLAMNQLVGPIPECLGNITSLREIHIFSNNLTSGIPSSIWNLDNLLNLSISSNSLTGPLSPQIGNLKAAISIDLSMNQLSGVIPDVFGGLTQLQGLYLAENDFRGSIPESMGSMVDLVSLDLSRNGLNGTIPKSLEALQHLVYLNLSYNELSGEIPIEGPFRNLTSRSFMHNSALCGPSRFNVSSCPESRHGSKKKKILIPLLVSIGIGALLFVICLAYTIIRIHRKKAPPSGSEIPSATGQPVRFSYYELLHATENYSENNLLGKGSFGSVYKGILRDGTVLAIKVFNIQLERSLKSFEVECEILRNLRHRNLVKVLGSCTNQDFKAIVLEYMRNGSLETCLYSANQSLDIMQRLDIMMDVASALEYLHHGYSTSVVHCDLKPENVLLDEDMVAHVSDFGITKYLTEGESITHTRTLATLGYMAPEYGSEGIVSTRCDTYSYGIMLLETFTAKRPSDEMFSAEDITLRDWVKGSMPDEVIEVIDVNLISPDENNFNKKLHCIISVLELGLICSANSPVERKNMKDVAAELKKIKMRFMTSYRETSHTVRAVEM